MEVTGNILGTEERTLKCRTEETQRGLGEAQDGNRGLGGLERGADPSVSGRVPEPPGGREGARVPARVPRGPRRGRRHVGARRDSPGAGLRGRAPLRLAGGGRRGLARRVTRASAIGRRGGVAVVTGRGGAGARPGSGVMAAAAAGAALLVLLMAAALAVGDDSDWVRLPSKCEGKRSLGGERGDRPPSAVCSGRGLLVRGCPSARLLPAGTAAPGSHRAPAGS